MPELDPSETPQVYALTALTREAGSARRVVILGFDAHLRGVVIAVAALALAAAPTFFAWLLIGPAALNVTGLIVAAAFYLVEHRTRSGLQLRTYQAMADRRNERIGQFICCGRRVHPNRTGIGTVRSSSMPSPYLLPTPAAVDRLFSPPLSDPSHQPSAHPPEDALPEPTAALRGHPRLRRRRRGADPFTELTGKGAGAPSRPGGEAG